MASHFTVITRRGGRFVYILQRECPGSTGLVAEAGSNEGTHFLEQNWAVPSHQAGQETRGLLSSPGGHSALPPATRSFLKLIVFHFLIITLLPHPKPNTEMCPLFTQPQGVQ